MNNISNDIIIKIYEYDNTYKKIFNNCVIEINKISYYDNSIIVQVSDNVINKNDFSLIMEEYKRIKNKYKIDINIEKNRLNKKYLIIEYEICKDKNSELKYIIYNNFYNINKNILKYKNFF